MAQKNLPYASSFQLRYEKGLRVFVLLFAIFHMWISFARHFFAPENRISSSDTLLTLFKAEKWAGLLLLVAVIVYLILSRTRFKSTWLRIKTVIKGSMSREMILLICLFVYSVYCCHIQSKSYTNIFKNADLELFDLAVCIFIFFLLPILLGTKKAKIYVDILLHTIMLISTAFIVWALWNLFHLHLVSLPNGLQVGMTESYSFYPGVNQNIGAAIGTTMILISMYMIATHRWTFKVVYSIALIVHLFATLLTNSRGNYVALLCALPLFIFMLVWLSSHKLSTAQRILFSGIAAGVTAIAVWQLRHFVFWFFERITHFSEYLNVNMTGNDVVREVSVDPLRLKIWRSSAIRMISSGKVFFFGTPLGLIPESIHECMEKIYGTSRVYAHAHNIILQTGLVAGVPGMLLFLGFLCTMVLPCVRIGIGTKEKQLSGAYVLPIAVLCMLIVNMFEPFLLFYISVMACLFFLFCGYIVAISREVPDPVTLTKDKSRNKNKKNKPSLT